MFCFTVNELERYLDPSYGESLELSDTVKLDLVLAHEEQLRNQHQQLNTMNSLKHVLDSHHIAGELWGWEVCTVHHISEYSIVFFYWFWLIRVCLSVCKVTCASFLDMLAYVCVYYSSVSVYIYKVQCLK